MAGFINIPEGTNPDDVYNAVAFVPPTDLGLQHVQQNIMQAVADAPNFIGGYVQNQLSTLNNVVMNNGFEKLKTFRDNVLYKNRTMMKIDIVQPFTTLTEVQQANPAMIPFIMAEPTLRKLYHNQMVDGYSGQYVDYQPGVIGDDHLAYQIVNDGIIHETEEGWEATCYGIEPDDELTLRQQLDVLDTHDLIRSILRSGRSDPTSTLDEERGK